MKIFFRVDSSSLIGSGHVVRCLTLAKSLKKEGAKCKFICKDYDSSFNKIIKTQGFEVIVLTNSNKLYKDFFNKNWEEDARQTINVIREEKIDWLVVDHYGLDIRWEKKLRPYTKKIMVIDDLANRKHDCELLLDQNLVDNFEKRYQNFLPKYANTLLGPKYALLQSEYKNKHLIASPRTGSVKNILIYFGATDKNNLTELIIKEFNKLNREDIFLNVVISSNSSQIKKIKNESKKNKKIKLFTNLSSLAPLMLKADISIGACGTTSWERCCLGLPAIVITLADNQRQIAKELHKRKVIYWLGHYDNIKINLISKKIEKLINQNLKNWSNRCKSITDGFGTQRVTSILKLNSRTKLKARVARIEDSKLILTWANDPLVRLNAFNSKIINNKTHNEWFNFRLNNSKKCVILIIETLEKIPIGQVRFEKKNRKWFINYSVASFARKKNISSKLLKTAIKKFKKNKTFKLIAEVKKDNIASCKVFEKIGFIKGFAKKNNSSIFKYQL